MFIELNISGVVVMIVEWEVWWEVFGVVFVMSVYGVLFGVFVVVLGFDVW